MQGKGLLALVLCTIVGLASNGCSVLCFGLGAISDSANPDTLTISGWEVQTVKPGKEMKLTLRDGEQLTGRYAGVDSVPEQQYAQSYASYRKQTGKEAPLPSLGEKIDITLNSGVQGERELLGFDYQYATAKTKGKEAPIPVTYHCAISVRHPGDTTSGTVPVSNIDRIVDGKGIVVKGSILEQLTSEGQVPFLSAVAIHDSSGRRQIGMEQVKRIELQKKRNTKWKLAAAGAAFDILLLLAAINYFDRPLFQPQ